MSDFIGFKIDDLPGESRPLLRDVRGQLGAVPNLHANMAASPELLAAYMTLLCHFAKSTLSAQEQQVVHLTSSFENEAEYCMAAHSALARDLNVDEAVLIALRTGAALPDAKLEALHRFTRAVVRRRGLASDVEIEAFLAVGYTPRNALEVVLGIATKVLSNYTTQIVQTQLDAFMRGNEWTKPEIQNSSLI